VSRDTTFVELGLPDSLVNVLVRGGIATPTTVQRAVVPDAMAGRDVLGRAATGSGKTLAFGLPVLARLSGSRSTPKSPRALVIVPTRELASQVRTSLEPLAHAVGLKLVTVYGGTPYDRQIKRLRSGADVVVATPGRLRDLVERQACRLDKVQVTVLDEADHLCDLGFYPEVTRLVAMTPADGQRLLLSATLDGDVDKLVREHLTDPVTHHCDARDEAPDIQHHVLVTTWQDKVQTAADLLRANPRSIVFTRTRHGATDLTAKLGELGVRAVDLHGALSQNARERNLRKFRSGQADAVVATDVAARGIHIDGVDLVVHFDAPTEQKAYLHRSGRTARAGSSGSVVTMTTVRQIGAVTKLQQAAGVRARRHDVRTAPNPLTAEALSRSGEVEPLGSQRPKQRRNTRPSAGAPRRPQPVSTKRQAVSSPVHRSADSNARTSPGPNSRPTGSPATRPRRRTGKKARWTASDRKSRRG
jgi:superfamily II DNA/RNA helicase